MGTNYYFESDKLPFENTKMHIGKSSGGWCFFLRVYPNLGINDLKDWEHIFNLNIGKISDEYDRDISPEEMAKEIKERFWNNPPKQDPKFYHRNFAVPGPKGLTRSIIDGNHCIGWGNNNDINSTWDLFINDFS